MKRLWPLLVIIPLLLGVAYRAPTGQDIVPYNRCTPCTPWLNLGTITASQATLAVDARDFSAVYTNLPDANTIKYKLSHDVTNAEIRFQTKANADAHVVELWVCADDEYQDGSTEDSFMLGAILTLTGGQQTGPNSNVFVDSIVAQEVLLTGSETLDSGNDRIAVWRVDLRGYKYVVAVATTFQASTTIYMDARWY